MSGGNWFHSRGAATAKALSPLNLSRDRGTYKIALLADLRGLEVDLNEIRSVWLHNIKSRAQIEKKQPDIRLWILQMF